MDLNGSYEFATGLYEVDRFFCPLFHLPSSPLPSAFPFPPVVNSERPFGFPANSQSIGIQEGSAKQYTTFQYGGVGGTLGFAAGGHDHADGQDIPLLVGLDSKGAGVSLDLGVLVDFEGPASYDIVDKGDFWCSSGFRGLDPDLLLVTPTSFTAMGLNKEWDLKRGMAAILSVGANVAYNASFTSPSGKQWTAKGNESPGGASAMLCSDEVGTWKFEEDGVLATSLVFAWADLVVLDLPPERFDWFPCDRRL